MSCIIQDVIKVDSNVFLTRLTICWCKFDYNRLYKGERKSKREDPDLHVIEKAGRWGGRHARNKNNSSRREEKKEGRRRECCSPAEFVTVERYIVPLKGTRK